ncbi:hypothetical protein [Salinimonas chungwhensis]|uniref:hypothetical protein n=1 Tax=Salinimonas chungwhensis TaxID=265425 RepID=UPI000370A728|nr:hypothetical protein [Salinimonas chungwhensis]
MANCYLITGQTPLAWPLIEALQIVGPLTPVSRCLPGWYRLHLVTFYGAIAPYEKVLDMDPHSPIGRLFLSWVYALDGETEKVIATSNGFTVSESETLPAHIAFNFRDTLKGKQSEFQLTEAQVSMASVNEMLVRFVAFTYAVTGNIEEATLWLRRAYQLGFCAYPLLNNHLPYFRAYRSYAPLEKLMLEIKQSWQTMTISHLAG